MSSRYRSKVFGTFALIGMLHALGCETILGLDGDFSERADGGRGAAAGVQGVGGGALTGGMGGAVGASGFAGKGGTQGVAGTGGGVAGSAGHGGSSTAGSGGVAGSGQGQGGLGTAGSGSMDGAGMAGSGATDGAGAAGSTGAGGSAGATGGAGMSGSAGAPGSCGPGGLDELSDDFGGPALNGALWNIFTSNGGSYAFLNGHLEMSVAYAGQSGKTASVDLMSKAGYRLSNCHATVHVAGFVNVNAGFYWAMLLNDTATFNSDLNSLMIEASTDGIQFERTVNGQYDELGVIPFSGSEQWLRIIERGGTTSFERSLDGTTWSVMASTLTPSYASSVHVQFYLEHAPGAFSNTQSALLDSFSTP
jgi:hypothetical protein